MSISIERQLGIFPDALAVRSRRMELIASNLANADTPGFKARDIDFRAALGHATEQQALTLKVTHAGHLDPAAGAIGGEALYRVPNQPSLDGNTVDTQLEQAAFAENAVQYQATLEFLSSKVSSFRKALKGE